MEPKANFLEPNDVQVGSDSVSFGKMLVTRYVIHYAAQMITYFGEVIASVMAR